MSRPDEKGVIWYGLAVGTGKELYANHCRYAGMANNMDFLGELVPHYRVVEED